MKRTEVRKRALLVAINTAWLMQEFLNNDEYLELYKLRESTMQVNWYIADLGIELYCFEQHFEYGGDTIMFDQLVSDIVKVVHSHAKTEQEFMLPRAAIYQAMKLQNFSIAAIANARIGEENDEAQ